MSIVEKIKKVLKKKNERIIIDLYLRDYDKSNFYIALVFNKKIEKFKVLYVPIDAIGNSDSVEEYFCYQFIFLHTVNYLLETVNKNEENFKDIKLDRCSDTMDSYYIEINTYVDSKNYRFTFTQYIDRDFKFLFDVVVTMFEHLPNVVNELCYKLLEDFNEDLDVCKYTYSYDFDLENDDVSNLFDKNVVKKCKYSFDDIKFIEKIGNRFYVVLKNYVIIVDDFSFNNIVNVSANGLEKNSEEIYIVFKAIKEKLEKKFYRLEVLNNDNDESVRTKYYFCYGIEEDYFKVIDMKNNFKVDLDLLRKGNVRILGGTESFIETLRKYLSEKYEDDKVEAILSNVIYKES